MPAKDPFGLVGQVLDGQFRVDQCIGEGGFSVVYRGTHVGLGEPIAVKCLKLPHALGSALVESFIKRFRDESRLHYRLSQGHLHIARSIASGTTVAPATSALVPYTVLEWLEGRTLADELDERRARGLAGRPLAEVIKLLDSAIDALAYAHAQGVVHRDLNPGNLFLASTSSGTKLKVLDFGVAKIMTDSTLAMGPAARTVGNVRIFTPAYGAPEQFDERLGPIGPWTDVYAVALLVVETMTDRTVIEGEHIGELAAKSLDPNHRPTPRALGVPIGDEVESALACALALVPDERPRDAGELWGLLKHAMAADKASGHEPHAVLRRRSPVPSTLRMAEAVPQGVVGSVVEVAHSGTSRPSASPQGFGGTLRMASPERGSAPLPALDALVASPPGQDDGLGDVLPMSIGPRTRRRVARSSLFIAVAIGIVIVCALLAAWLLAPQAAAGGKG